MSQPGSPGGAPPPPPPPQSYPPPTQQYYGGYAAPASTNGFAIASLVLGIVWIWWVGSVLALVFGYVARGQIKRTGERGEGLAIAGIVLGWIGVATLVLFLITAVGMTHTAPHEVIVHRVGP